MPLPSEKGKKHPQTPLSQTPRFNPTLPDDIYIFLSAACRNKATIIYAELTLMQSRKLKKKREAPTLFN